MKGQNGVLFFLVLAGCASAGTTSATLATSPTVGAPGRLVIVGGALSAGNAPVYRAILDGRQGKGPLCVFPTAGATPDSDMASPVEIFNRQGGAGTAVGVLVSSGKPESAHDPGIVEQIQRCSGFFFIGGVQSRVIAAFRPQGHSTPAYDALMERWRAGAVVSGSSAGAAIMSDPMIAGGTSAEAMAKGVKRITYVGADGDDSTGGVTLAPGLGFFRAALADQHFLTRGRFGRLLTAMLATDEFDLAFGIDENTALVVDPDSLKVVGASGVVVFDERTAHRDARSTTDVTMYLLGDGDRFDLRSRRPALDPMKPEVVPTRRAPIAVENAFARLELLRVLGELAATQATRVTMPFEGGRIEIRKVEGFSARIYGGTGALATTSGLGMTGLRLDVIR